MRRTRIEKPRRRAGARRYQDATPARGSAQQTCGLRASLDPRDPDVVRAKRLARQSDREDGQSARP
ncbi:hypothetical protein HCJ93_05175 [Streptomyces sp. SBST2-5]|uniref:Uncharacterized protein n=1 Tax=Streptomyces composti TaxID=2720025 RepID=A0ABX1A6K0_9ACTN|nr:hypothetical protein [Streptomyces composti]NJP49483.1 hypothetical protein [Streptomyces composti]